MILCCLCLPYSGSGLLYCFCPPCYAEILILFCPSYTQVYCLMLALFVQGLLATLAISVLTLSCLYRACLQQQYKGFQSALCIRTAQSGPGTVCVCVCARAHTCVCVCVAMAAPCLMQGRCSCQHAGHSCTHIILRFCEDMVMLWPHSIFDDTERLHQCAGEV